MTNPYSPGAGMPPPALVGRDDSRILQRDLADLLGEVAQHANERQKGVVITIDEIQHLVPMFDEFIRRHIT